MIIPLDLKKSKNSITNFFKKEQEVKEDEKEASIVPAKHSHTSDDETNHDTKKKSQKSDPNVSSSPEASITLSTPSTPTKTSKKPLKSTPSRKQPPRKKKVNDVKANEKITGYFTSLS